MLFGVQYYPEHWPEERWAVDFAMMQRAGVNVLRMGEFAWSSYEPAEGQYDFDWMARALDGALAHGIRVIMCTCSRTPPPWVYAQYPGVLNQKADRSWSATDGRYAIGLGHPEFRELAARIDQAVIDRFARHPAIVGWQVDNEVGSGNDCHCERCLEQFREYLRSAFGSVESLMEALGPHFWSFHVSDFRHVSAPHHNPQLMLAYRRFLSSLNVSFVAERCAMIRRADPQAFVTTNFQSGGANHSDYADMVEPLDVPSMNHYPARSPQFVLDLHRGQQEGLLVLEQFTRLGNVDAGPGRMRLWAYLALAHGCTGLTFFRWRPCRWGREQFGDGLLPHSGAENERYRQLARMGRELEQLGDVLDTVQPTAEVAILHSYPARWSLDSYSYGLPVELNHFRTGVAYHEMFMHRNIPCDVVPARADLGKYRLIVAPALFLVDEATAATLCEYVHQGGHLVLTAGSGVVDAYGKSFGTMRPGPLADVAGVAVDELLPLEAPVPLSVPGNACGIADSFEATTAEVIARFAGGWRKGTPVITRNRYGAGLCSFVGALLDEPAMDRLISELCAQTGVAPVLQTPQGVAAYRLVDHEQELLMLLNNTESTCSVDVAAGWTDALTAQAVTSVEIPAVDLRLLVRPLAG